MLFSEPKIPQHTPDCAPPADRRFQCSSASRKFLNCATTRSSTAGSRCFSALQRAENSSNTPSCRAPSARRGVSVLFSEPKIPQTERECRFGFSKRGFSALQRAENSSNLVPTQFEERIRAVFQCSSASRKFLKRDKFPELIARLGFQCSSASRKFLKHTCDCLDVAPHRVSVLFSEPKIPQTELLRQYPSLRESFSALQRAENSSNFEQSARRADGSSMFQCSSASRKFLKGDRHQNRQRARVFQCSSASRKFLKR